MSSGLRRVRGAVLMGLTWAVAWAPVGMIVGRIVDPDGSLDGVWVPIGAAPGFLCGILFSAALAIAEGHRRFDELSLARAWDSRDEREAALLRYLRPLAEQRNCPSHLLEEAREAGWSDEQLLEAIAVVALETFTAMVHVAGDVPADGSVEDARVLRAA